MTGMPRSACPEGLNPGIPLKKLRNARNLCYANSSAQAFYWSCKLASDADRCAGALKAGVLSLASTGSVYLPAMLTWRRAFQNWMHLSLSMMSVSCLAICCT